MKLIFRKFLKKTDVSRVSVPSKCLKKLPSFEGGHVVGLDVRDRRGIFSRFRCFIRKKGPHRKPVLSGDWKRFAQSNGLGIDDEVKLYEEIDQATGALHYKVEVNKAIRLLGVTLGHGQATIL